MTVASLIGQKHGPLPLNAVKRGGQKADDAKIPFDLWDNMFIKLLPPHAPSLHPYWRTSLNGWRAAALVR